MLIRVMSYNPRTLFRWSEPEREARVISVIRKANPDVLLVQELAAHTEAEAIASARRLAAATGLTCEIARGPGRDAIYTVAKGSRPHAVVILWKKDAKIRPVPDSWRVIKDMFWHAYVVVGLEVDGVVVDHACYHGPPTDGRKELDEVQWERETEAKIIAALASRPDRPPLLVGSDSNFLSADKIGNGDYYGVRRVPEGASPAHRALRLNRRAGEILLEAGLADIGAAKFDPDVGRKLTTGHWRSDSSGGSNIDSIRGTAEIVAATRVHDVINTPEARAASDHLPVVVVYDATALR